MRRPSVDTRTDIYSLGVMLYELLTGALPFAAAELRQGGLLEIQRMIREDEPPKPSTRLGSLGDASDQAARARGCSTIALARDLRGDLDWITMMALAKDRSRRYATAAALAEDIGRHLGHEPVMASPPSVVYRVRKLVRRNRIQVVAAALVLGSLVAGIVVAEKGRAGEREQREIANAKTKQAEDMANLAAERASEAEDERNKARESAREARYESYVANIRAASAALGQHEVDYARDYLADAPEEHRNWEWSYLHSLTEQSFAVHERMAFPVFSPDGQRCVVIPTDDKEVVVWNADASRELAVLDGHEADVVDAQWSPDGTRIVTASWDKTARVWDPATGDLIAILLGHQDKIRTAAFSGDGSTIVTMSEGAVARLWNAESHEEISRIPAPNSSRTPQVDASGARVVDRLAKLQRPDLSCELNHDGSRLVWFGSRRDPSISLWATNPPQLVESVHGSFAAFNPDGTRLVTSFPAVYDSGSGVELLRLGDKAILRGNKLVSYSPDGTRIAALGERELRLSDAESGALIWTRHVRQLSTPERNSIGFADARSLVFSAGGTRLATSHGNFTSIHDVPSGTIVAQFRHAHRVYGVGLSPDGSRLMTATTAAAIPPPPDKLRRIELAIEAEGIVSQRTRSLLNSASVHLWDASGPSNVTVLAPRPPSPFRQMPGYGGGPEGIVSASFDKSGRHVLTCTGNELTLWDVFTGESSFVLKEDRTFPPRLSWMGLDSAAFSPDGEVVVASSGGNWLAHMPEVFPRSDHRVGPDFGVRADQVRRRGAHPLRFISSGGDTCWDLPTGLLVCRQASPS